MLPTPFALLHVAGAVPLHDHVAPITVGGRKSVTVELVAPSGSRVPRGYRVRHVEPAGVVKTPSVLVMLRSVEFCASISVDRVVRRRRVTATETFACV